MKLQNLKISTYNKVLIAVGWLQTWVGEKFFGENLFKIRLEKKKIFFWDSKKFVFFEKTGLLHSELNQNEGVGVILRNPSFFVPNRRINISEILVKTHLINQVFHVLKANSQSLKFLIKTLPAKNVFLWKIQKNYHFLLLKEGLIENS